MGEPALREFDQTSEEWNHCKIGSNADEYPVINLQNSMLIGSILRSTLPLSTVRLGRNN
jgi:hypothetical protein